MAECNHRFVHFSGQPQRVCSECSLPYIEFVLERNRELEQQLQAQAELLDEYEYLTHNGHQLSYRKGTNRYMLDDYWQAILTTSGKWSEVKRKALQEKHT